MYPTASRADDARGPPQDTTFATLTTRRLSQYYCPVGQSMSEYDSNSHLVTRPSVNNDKPLVSQSLTCQKVRGRNASRLADDATKGPDTEKCFVTPLEDT